MDALESLGSALRQLGSKQPDTLSSRRQRQKLMADLDAASMARPLARPSQSRAAVWICGFAALGVTAFFGHLVRDRWFPRPPVVTETLVEVRPERGATWFQTKRENLNRIDLIEGSLWLRIRRPSVKNPIAANG